MSQQARLTHPNQQRNTGNPERRRHCEVCQITKTQMVVRTCTENGRIVNAQKNTKILKYTPPEEEKQPENDVSHWMGIFC